MYGHFGLCSTGGIPITQIRVISILLKLPALNKQVACFGRACMRQSQALRISGFLSSCLGCYRQQGASLSPQIPSLGCLGIASWLHLLQLLLIHDRLQHIPLMRQARKAI